MALFSKKSKKFVEGPIVPVIKFKPHMDCSDIINGSVEGSGDIYANHSFSFSACSEIKNNATEQLFEFHGCRETYIERIMSHFSGKTTINKLSTRKTTLMVWTSQGKNGADVVPNGCKGPHSSWILESMKAGLRLVNHFERENKWLKSKLYKAQLPEKSKSHVYIMEGSRWWLTSTHILSLYMLLIRLGKRGEVQEIRKNATTEEIINVIQAFKTGTDYTNVVHAWKWPILLNNRRAIYKGRRTFSENFSETSSSLEGIKRLTTGDAEDKVVRNRFAEFCKRKKK